MFLWLEALRAPGVLSPGDAQKRLVGPKLSVAQTRQGSYGRRVKCGQLGLICLPHLTWCHDPCPVTAPALHSRSSFLTVPSAYEPVHSRVTLELLKGMALVLKHPSEATPSTSQMTHVAWSSLAGAAHLPMNQLPSKTCTKGRVRSCLADADLSRCSTEMCKGASSGTDMPSVWGVLGLDALL